MRTIEQARAWMAEQGIKTIDRRASFDDVRVEVIHDHTTVQSIIAWRQSNPELWQAWPNPRDIAQETLDSLCEAVNRHFEAHSSGCRVHNSMGDILACWAE